MTIANNFNCPPDGYTYRECRPEDAEALEGVITTHPVIGGTICKNDVPVGYAGVNLIAGEHWVFFYIGDDNLRRTMWLARLMRDSLKMVKASGVKDLYALCDTRIPRATEFLKFLGFRPLGAYEKSVAVITYENLMGAKAWVHKDLI